MLHQRVANAEPVEYLEALPAQAGLGGHPFEQRRVQVEVQAVGYLLPPAPQGRHARRYDRHLAAHDAGLARAPAVHALPDVHRGAQVHDSKVFEELVDGVEPVKGARGRPRKRPEKLHADKGYDYERCRRFLHRRGIKARIARRGVQSSQRLGRHRWVVERTLAWLSCYRRLCVRYERRADIHEAFLELGCALVCFSRLRRG